MRHLSGHQYSFADQQTPLRLRLHMLLEVARRELQVNGAICPRRHHGGMDLVPPHRQHGKDAVADGEASPDEFAPETRERSIDRSL